MRLTIRPTALAVTATVLFAACTGAAASPSPVPATPAATAALASPAATATAAPASATAAPSLATSPVPNACAAGSLKTKTPGKLTIGTDNPAYGPWFGGTPPAGSKWQVSDPASGQGLESATAYAIADKLGFTKDQVVWVAVPFNNVIQPGPKAFDIDLNQVSYSAERAQAVDMSDGYFDDNQAVVALKSNAIAGAKSVADLKAYKLGTQVGTTSYSYIVNNIQPTKKPAVYSSTDAAVAALKAKQLDGVVVDLGTAFFIRDAELDNGTIVGSLPTVGEQEHFSVVLNKGSSLTECVNLAIAALKGDGTLDKIRKQWIESEGSVPALQ